MRTLIVKYATVTDALGRKRSGWIVFEAGLPGYPYESKEKAIRNAEAIASLRVVDGQKPQVIVIDKV